MGVFAESCDILGIATKVVLWRKSTHALPLLSLSPPLPFPFLSLRLPFSENC